MQEFVHQQYECVRSRTPETVKDSGGVARGIPRGGRVGISMTEQQQIAKTEDDHDHRYSGNKESTEH